MLRPPHLEQVDLSEAELVDQLGQRHQPAGHAPPAIAAHEDVLNVLPPQPAEDAPAAGYLRGGTRGALLLMGPRGRTHGQSKPGARHERHAILRWSTSGGGWPTDHGAR